MIEITYLSLTYPDRETALQVARGLSGNPDVTEFPPDGWLGPIYYNIVDIGSIYTPTVLNELGEVVSGNELVPGYHLLGTWRGSLDTVPDPVRFAHVQDRPSWWPRIN